MPRYPPAFAVAVAAVPVMHAAATRSFDAADRYEKFCTKNMLKEVLVLEHKARGAPLPARRAPPLPVLTASVRQGILLASGLIILTKKNSTTG
jgi:hypothetical protein